MEAKVKISENIKILPRLNNGDLRDGQMFIYDGDIFIKLNNENGVINCVQFKPLKYRCFYSDGWPDEILEGEITVTITERIKN